MNHLITVPILIVDQNDGEDWEESLRIEYYNGSTFCICQGDQTINIRYDMFDKIVKQIKKNIEPALNHLNK